MARILNIVDARWYDELKAVSYYGETELEKRILQHARELFPHHYVFPFKKDVHGSGETTPKRPDLCLIRRDLSSWVIVEVEIEGHSLKHVLDQTRVFLAGDYNAPEVAEYVRGQLKSFCQKTVSVKRLTGLFSAKAPSVMVIVDSENAGWLEELNRGGVDVCVFEIYKNVRGHYVYRTFGQYPAVVSEEAHCRPHQSMPNVIEIVGNIHLKTKRSELEVSFDQLLTRWTPFEDNGKKYLRLAGRANPLSPTDSYGLYRDKSNRYFFHRS